MASFHKVLPWNKFISFDAFSVITLKGETDFPTGNFEEVFCFPSALVIVAEDFEKEFLRNFISKYVFPFIAS